MVFNDTKWWWRKFVGSVQFFFFLAFLFSLHFFLLFWLPSCATFCYDKKWTAAWHNQCTSIVNELAQYSSWINLNFSSWLKHFNLNALTVLLLHCIFGWFCIFSPKKRRWRRYSLSILWRFIFSNDLFRFNDKSNNKNQIISTFIDAWLI